MIDQSAVKIFLLLKEKKEQEWVLPIRKLKKHTLQINQIDFKEHNFLTFPQFLKFGVQNQINHTSIFQSLCSTFPIFDFIFSQDFQKISHEIIVLIRDNHEFLREFYQSFEKELLDPIDLSRNPNLFHVFVDGFSHLGMATDILPNLISLKEFLLLVVYVKRHRDLNIKESKPETPDEAAVFTFDEFKTLLVILNKYLRFKYLKIYDLHEETYLSNLLWYLFLKLVNNKQMQIDPQLKVHNQKADQNFFFQLNKFDLNADAKLEVQMIQNLELLFLLFSNHFSNVGNPELVLDLKSFGKAKGFEQHVEWIKSFNASIQGKAVFPDFLTILTKVVSIRRENVSKDSVFQQFIENNSYSIKTQLETEYKDIPKLKEDLNRKVKSLFSKFTVKSGNMYVMDFIFMAKKYEIVPNQYNNKQIMVLFYQANLRDLLKRFKTKNDIFEVNNFFYINLTIFVKLLVEIAENFIGGAIYLDFEEKLELMFSKIIRS